MDAREAERVWRNNDRVKTTREVTVFAYDGTCQTSVVIPAGAVGYPEAAELGDDGNIERFEVCCYEQFKTAPYGFKEFLPIDVLAVHYERPDCPVMLARDLLK